jgi:esterase/lipase superfamily enzyme
LLAAALLTGCDNPVRLMPTPVSFRSGDVDPFEQAGAKLQGTEVPVFYVTNRGAVIEKPEPVHTIVPSERLRMGVAHVRIGDDTLDWGTLHRLSTSDDPAERPIVKLEWLEQMASLAPGDAVGASPDARAFFALVDKALAASQSQELLVYVHGANNSVALATAQAAQLRHFTGRRMVVVAFLWPSAGSILRYFTDVGNAKSSVEPFARLIEMLAAHTHASAIDVLAYSAGAQIASPGLAHLRATRPSEPREQFRRDMRVKHVYFAAPDIDTRRFIDELGRYIDVVDRVSIAANLNDSALRFASVVHRASRAGRPNPTELDARQSGFMIDASRNLGFDLIKVDPNDIPNLPLRSHDFWYEDPWVSGDLLGLLLLNADPPRRGLDEREAISGSRYWTFPPDFNNRVVRLFVPAPGAAAAAAGPGSTPR